MTEAACNSVGYDADMSQQAPKAVLTSPVWNWGPKYVEIIKQIMAGTYKTESFWGGWKDGTVDLAPIGSMVPDDVKKMAEDEIAKFKSGQQDIFAIFSGPINDQNGNLVVAAGQTLSADDLLSNMTWFVEGVNGTAPGLFLRSCPYRKDQTGCVIGPWVTWLELRARSGAQALKKLPTWTIRLSIFRRRREAFLRDPATKGNKLIFATSFGYMDSVMAAAKDFPNVIFEHCTGYETADNVGIYDGRGYQGWYLAGMVAGKMTKKNVLGYVAPFSIPEVVRNMNAFTLGARSVNPDVQVHVVWINTWYDPTNEREAAQALIDQGADVVARESDSAEADKLSEQAGVYAVGYNFDSTALAPKAVLTAPIFDWGIYYTKIMQSVHDGTWKNTPFWGSMADGVVKLGPFGSMVPEDVKQLVEANQKRSWRSFDVRWSDPRTRG